MDTEVAELKKIVESLSKEVTRLAGKLLRHLSEAVNCWYFSDEAEIKKLHFKYGYYLDKCLYQEVKIPSIPQTSSN
jgi:hypothetical protein